MVAVIIIPVFQVKNILGFSRETEPIGYETYYERLAHTIMQAEQSHSLPSANWRPRKVGVVVSVQTQKPENQGSQLCKSQF